MSSALSMVLQSLASVPMMIVWVVVLIMGAARMQRQPTFGLLVVSSMAIFLVSAVTRTVVYAVLPQFNMGSSDLVTKYAVMNVLFSVIGCIGWVLLAIALFHKERDTQPGGQS